MKIKEYKNKIVLAELNPEADYIMIVNPALVEAHQLKHIKARKGLKIYILYAHDIHKAIKFVEIPKKP